MSTNLKDFENLPDPQTKAELLERMAVAYETAENFIAAHTETTLITPLHPGGWSIKDHLAHLNAWEHGMIALLQKEDRWLEMGVNQAETDINDTDAVNDTIQNNHKNQSLSATLAKFRQTQQTLLETLAPLTDADLQKPYKYYQPQAEGKYTANPVMGWLAGDTYAHYAEHLEEIGRLLD